MKRVYKLTLCLISFEQKEQEVVTAMASKTTELSFRSSDNFCKGEFIIGCKTRSTECAVPQVI